MACKYLPHYKLGLGRATRNARPQGATRVLQDSRTRTRGHRRSLRTGRKFLPSETFPIFEDSYQPTLRALYVQKLNAAYW